MMGLSGCLQLTIENWAVVRAVGAQIFWRGNSGNAFAPFIDVRQKQVAL